MNESQMLDVFVSVVVRRDAYKELRQAEIQILLVFLAVDNFYFV